MKLLLEILVIFIIHESPNISSIVFAKPKIILRTQKSWPELQHRTHSQDIRVPEGGRSGYEKEPAPSLSEDLPRIAEAAPTPSLMKSKKALERHRSAMGSMFRISGLLWRSLGIYHLR